MTTRDVEEKFAQAWNRAGLLPATQQVQYRNRLLQLKRAAAAAAARKPAVSGESDGWEWDLALANQLDAIWTAVTGQSEKVYNAVKTEAAKAVEATAKGAAQLGLGFMPIALIALAAFYLAGGGKR